VKITGQTDIAQLGQALGLEFSVFAESKCFRKNENSWTARAATIYVKMPSHRKAIGLIGNEFAVHLTLHRNGWTVSMEGRKQGGKMTIDK
jgi:hypothetical protein